MTGKEIIERMKEKNRGGKENPVQKMLEKRKKERKKEFSKLGSGSSRIEALKEKVRKEFKN